MFKEKPLLKMVARLLRFLISLSLILRCQLGNFLSCHGNVYKTSLNVVSTWNTGDNSHPTSVVTRLISSFIHYILLVLVFMLEDVSLGYENYFRFPFPNKMH